MLALLIALTLLTLILLRGRIARAFLIHPRTSVEVLSIIVLVGFFLMMVSSSSLRASS